MTTISNRMLRAIAHLPHGTHQVARDCRRREVLASETLEGRRKFIEFAPVLALFDEQLKAPLIGELIEVAFGDIGGAAQPLVVVPSMALDKGVVRGPLIAVITRKPA